MELSIKDAFVVYNYGTRSENTSLKGINLTIHEADRITVIGNNDDGKSTLLRIISGQLNPTFGKVIINCEGTTNYNSSISYISSDNVGACFSGLSVVENLVLAMLSGKNCHMFKQAVTKERIDVIKKYINMYDFFDVADILNASIDETTNLQKRVIALLISLIKKDKMLIVDDITENLSHDASIRLITTMKNIVQDNGMTLVAVMSDPKMEFEFFNRCVILREGKITLDVCGDAKKQLNFESILEHFNLMHTW